MLLYRGRTSTVDKLKISQTPIKNETTQCNNAIICIMSNVEVRPRWRSAIRYHIIYMKLSYNWLQDFVDLSNIKLDELVEKMTMQAFEVESVEASGIVLGNDVVLGEIREIAKHPDADKLNVTQTCIGYNADGSENIQQIVCGASNIKVGQKVPVATIGAEVTNRHDGSKLLIKKSKIRGVESCGMLCSPDELGLSETAVNSIKEKQGDGIYILNELAGTNKFGTAISSIINQSIDYVLEVGARSNRGDALSVYGQAREIAAVTGKQLKAKTLSEKEFHFNPNVKNIEPRIVDEKDCSLFFTVAIEGIEIKESPTWLQERINAMGTKSINNVVDISNYVLLELGQPMHFYDREKITGNYLEVRRAKPNEELTTLEEKTYELNETNLVIADTNGPSSLAGVMGGLNSSINDNTKNIVIEVAIFNPASVRKSARAAGVESESKRRFERGVDKAFAKTALLRALELLQELAAGANFQIGLIQVAGSEEIPSKTVSLRSAQIKRLLGIDIPQQTYIQILESLGIKLVDNNSEETKFSIPSHRQSDISREADLIEEIGRLYGFDNIPIQTPSSVSAQQNLQALSRTKAKITEAFIAAGFSEARLSSLIGDSLLELDACAKQELATYIEMDNPLSREHRSLRQSILPGLIQAASRNYAYDKSIDIKLFELGKTYYAKSTKAERDDTVEEAKLAAILVKIESDWTQAKPKTLAENFFYFKSIIENLYPRAKFSSAKNANTLIHPGISAEVTQDGRKIGMIAKLHPSITKEWDLPDESYVLELDYPKLKEPKFKAIASTPIVERDITVDSSDNVDVQTLQDLMQKKLPKDLREVKLVSLFRRTNTDAASKAKSSTFRLKFQSDTETLNGEAIDQAIEQLKQILEKELGVGFRG